MSALAVWPAPFFLDFATALLLPPALRFFFSSFFLSGIFILGPSSLWPTSSHQPTGYMSALSQSIHCSKVLLNTAQYR